jgi:hypothetical protein
MSIFSKVQPPKNNDVSDVLARTSEQGGTGGQRSRNDTTDSPQLTMMNISFSTFFSLHRLCCIYESKRLKRVRVLGLSPAT